MLFIAKIFSMQLRIFGYKFYVCTYVRSLFYDSSVETTKFPSLIRGQYLYMRKGMELAKGISVKN